jgi:hypothetical protein
MGEFLDVAGTSSGTLALVPWLFGAAGCVLMALLNTSSGNDDDDSSPGGGIMQPVA